MTDIPKGAVELAEKWIFDVVRHDTGQWISPEARNEIASLIAEAVKPLEEAGEKYYHVSLPIKNIGGPDYGKLFRAALKKWREG